jgi:hypothetical protein
MADNAANSRKRQKLPPETSFPARVGPPWRPDERLVAQYFRPPDARADFAHREARRAFYVALRTYFPPAYDELVKAAEKAPFAFLESLVEWLARYKLTPAPDCALSPFTNDFFEAALNSKRPFAVTARVYSHDYNEDWVEVSCLLRFQVAKSIEDVDGRYDVSVMSEEDAKKDLERRFREMLKPQLRGIYENSQTLGVVAPPARQLESDMRRLVQKQFGRNTAKEILDDERAQGVPGPRTVRSIDRSMERAADALGLQIDPIDVGRPPTRPAADRRS